MPEAVIEADALLDRGIHGVFVVESVFVCESEAPLGWAVSNCVVDRAPVQTCVAFCVEGLAPFFGMAISKLAANVKADWGNGYYQMTASGIGSYGLAAEIPWKSGRTWVTRMS